MDGSVVNMEEKLLNASSGDRGEDAREYTQDTPAEETGQNDSEIKESFLEILAEERKNGGISYQLRALKDKDLFPMLNILKKIGIKDLKNAFVQNNTQDTSSEEAESDNSDNAENIKSIKDIGLMTAFDLVDILTGNLQNIENEVYDLWSDISGIPVDEMKELEFGTLPLMIADTFAQAGNNSFFRVLSRLLS